MVRSSSYKGKSGSCLELVKWASGSPAVNDRSLVKTRGETA